MNLPKHYYSWTTMIGIAIALTSLAIILFLFLLTTILDIGTSYSGLFTYIIMPSIMVIGMLLIPIGIIRKRARERKGHIERELKFPASSVKRDTIVWVKYTNLETGAVSIYKDPNIELDEAALDTLEHRKMDCLDCHNRPSHNYLSPSRFFDDAVTAGKISRNLPEIKLATMSILTNDFPTKDSAFQFIESELLNFYESSYPEVFNTNRIELDATIKEIQYQYSQNVFPFMKVKWSAYPNYLGHMENNGCYRCHNDSFENKAGQTISRDCNLCHLIKAQGPPDNLEYAVGDSSLTFRHPIDIKNKWKRMLCAECHAELY